MQEKDMEVSRKLPVFSFPKVIHFTRKGKGITILVGKFRLNTKNFPGGTGKCFARFGPPGKRGTKEKVYQRVGNEKSVLRKENSHGNSRHFFLKRRLKINIMLDCFKHFFQELSRKLNFWTFRLVCSEYRHIFNCRK